MLAFTTRSKAVFLALAIFLLGMVCGAVVDRQIILKRARSAAAWWQGRGEGGRPDVKNRMLDRYERELDLNAAQKRKLAAILEVSRSEMGEIRKGVRGKLEAVARDTRTQIRELLTPEQQEKFNKLRERRRRRRHRPPRRP